MKRKYVTPFLLAYLALASSCGEDVKATDILDSGKQAMEGLDLSELDVDGMKEKVTELAGSLGTQLGNIKDEASAIDIGEKVGPAIDQLSKLKGMLGDKMPSLDSLGGIVSDLTSKFGGDEGIMKVLGPLLEKLKGLLG